MTLTLPALHAETPYRAPAYSPDEITRAVLRDVDALAGHEEIRRVYAARVARFVAGAWLAACACAMSLGALAEHGEHAVTALRVAWLGVVPLALAAWALARLRAPADLASRAAKLLAGEAVGPATRSEWATADGIERLFASAGAGAARAASWPLVGLALAAPLGLHLLFQDALRGQFGYFVGGEFGQWIRLSLVIVGYVHVVLAVLGWRCGRALARGETRGTSGWAALGWTVLWSCGLGALVVFIPVILVAVTGAVFVPLAWKLVALRVASEREAVARAAAALAADVDAGAA